MDIVKTHTNRPVVHELLLCLVAKELVDQDAVNLQGDSQRGTGAVSSHVEKRRHTQEAARVRSSGSHVRERQERTNVNQTKMNQAT